MNKNLDRIESCADFVCTTFSLVDMYFYATLRSLNLSVYKPWFKHLKASQFGLTLYRPTAPLASD